MQIGKEEVEVFCLFVHYTVIYNNQISTNVYYYFLPTIFYTISNWWISL